MLTQTLTHTYDRNMILEKDQEIILQNHWNVELSNVHIPSGSKLIVKSDCEICELTLEENASLEVQGNLVLIHDPKIKGTLLVSGNAEFIHEPYIGRNAEVEISGDLNVTHTCIIDGDVYVKGNAEFIHGLILNGQFECDGDFRVAHSRYFFNNGWLAKNASRFGVEVGPLNTLRGLSNIEVYNIENIYNSVQRLSEKEQRLLMRCLRRGNMAPIQSRERTSFIDKIKNLLGF